jgi:hypothetical protein
MIGDCIEANDSYGERVIYRVLSLSEGDIQLQLHCDARDSKELRAGKARIRVGGEKLRKMMAVKVEMDPLGEFVRLAAPEV